MHTQTLTVEELINEISFVTKQLSSIPVELERALKSPSDLINYCFYMARHLLSMRYADPDIVGPYSEKYFYTGLQLMEHYQEISEDNDPILEPWVFLRAQETMTLLGIYPEKIPDYLSPTHEEIYIYK